LTSLKVLAWGAASFKIDQWRLVNVVDDIGDLWVFGYGSLMWRPGFTHGAPQMARLIGYRRALCVRSFVHRGTQDKPGLVLGLDRGGSCRGMAFPVQANDRDVVIAYLRERELVTNVYLERIVKLQLADGRNVPALTYVVDRNHIQYAGRLEPDEAATIVAGASGMSGKNPDYVLNTLTQLRIMNIHDRFLEAVGAALIAANQAEGPNPKL
jgi:glutathione-specific gamma-glutamylcyclotransferase